MLQINDVLPEPVGPMIAVNELLANNEFLFSRPLPFGLKN